MATAAGPASPSKTAHTLINFQDLIESWAEEYFLKKANKKEKKLYDKGLIASEIDWKRVNIEQEAPEYDINPLEGTVPLTSVLFQTTFTNRTRNQQKYTFRTERTTRSSCTVAMENSFTQGYEMSLGLKLPNEILEANAGFSREISLTNSKEQTIEQEMTWSVDSEIDVDKETKAIAELVITEEQFNGGFSFKSTIKGKIRVIFTNLKDNNSYITSVEGPIYQIIQEAIKDGRIKGKCCIVENRAIVCTTQGKCSFRFGVRQDVEVKQQPIE